VTQLALLSVRTTPRTRGECEEGVRPCPFYACRHHLWAEDERPGRPHHGKHPLPVVREHSAATCALDVAHEQERRDAKGMLSQERVGEALGITGERVRQIEQRALAKLMGEHGLDLEEILGVRGGGEDEDDEDDAPAPRRERPVVQGTQLDLLK
jgi:hypothetical protein